MTTPDDASSNVLLCMNMNSIALLRDRKRNTPGPLLSLDRLPIESSPIELDDQDHDHEGDDKSD